MAIRSLDRKGAAARRILSYRLLSRLSKCARTATGAAGHAALCHHQFVLHNVFVRAPANVLRCAWLLQQCLLVHDAVGNDDVAQSAGTEL